MCIKIEMFKFYLEEANFIKNVYINVFFLRIYRGIKSKHLLFTKERSIQYNSNIKKQKCIGKRAKQLSAQNAKRKTGSGK